MRKRVFKLLTAFICTFGLLGCTDPVSSPIDQSIMPSQVEPSKEDELHTIIVQIKNKEFPLLIEHNPAADQFLSSLPLTLSMDELNGNEKYCYLPNVFSTTPAGISQIQAGDLLLFGTNCLVLFYENLSSSYDYTRLGRVQDIRGLAQAVGSGNVEVTFHKEN